ncbi:Peptidyl-tRNA hydrolase PTH2 [Gracilaria domingensis]|nr:Peptidyl-tRNA hydrolase PTH2 [Gracilaria domingensis]
MSSSSPQAEDVSQPSDPLVQYVVVRRDLLEQWPVGSVIAQGVHASVAAIWQSRLTSPTTQYCSPRQPSEDPNASNTDMRTVVLAAKSEQAVLNLAQRLEEKGVGFALWKEQPEDFVTALAAYPGLRSNLKPHFAKFKLFK